MSSTPAAFTSLVDLQTPGQVSRPAEELLVEIVTEPADRLGENDSRRDRVAERRQRYPPQPTRNPRTDASQRDGTPDAEPAVPDPQGRKETCTFVAEVRSPVGDDVIETATDKPERHSPQRDVVDDAGFASPGRPSPVPDHQGGDDPDDDEQRIRPQRERAEDSQTP